MVWRNHRLFACVLRCGYYSVICLVIASIYNTKKTTVVVGSWAPCKRTHHCRPTTPNIVGCHMLCPFAHPDECRCVLLGFVLQSLKPVKLLATWETGTIIPNNVASVCTRFYLRRDFIIHLNLYLLLLKIFPRYVNLACLPHQVNAPTDGKRCWITGWGRLSSGGATPDLLQQVSVPIVSRAHCDKAYPNKIHDSMICAGLDQGGIDSCQGDSGGPMVCETGGQYYLHGATSWGYGCAAKGKFGVYAKVKYLMSWITNEMKKN